MSGCYQFQKDVCTNWFLFLTMRLRLISESVLVSVNTGFLTRSLLLFQPQFLRGKVRSKETMGFMRTGGGGSLSRKGASFGRKLRLKLWMEGVCTLMNGEQKAFQMQRALWRKAVENDRRRQAAWRRCCLPNKKGERWVTWNGLGSQKQRLWLQGTQQARNTALALPSLPVHRVDEQTVCDWEGSLERMRVRQQEISENFSLHFIILGYFAFWICFRIKVHGLSIYFCKTTWHILYCLNFKINHSRRWDGLLEDMI